MNRTNPRVDNFLGKASKWRQEMEQLRRIALDCGLAEEFKWGKPCYTFQNHNVAILQGFKESCALMFFKGALLKDRNGVLDKPGENSRVARRVTFSSVGDILRMERVLRACIREAIKVEEAGLKVDLERNPAPIPEEFQQKLNEVPGLKASFEALTPGRQRAYILHFSAAKQSKTRTSRVEKCIPRILDGRGLDD